MPESEAKTVHDLMFQQIWGWEVVGTLSVTLYFTGVGIVAAEGYGWGLVLCVIGVLLASIKFASWEYTRRLHQRRFAVATIVNLFVSVCLVLFAILWANRVEDSEPVNSLRSRIIEVTNELSWILNDGAKNHPPDCITTPTTTKDEALKAVAPCEVYNNHLDTVYEDMSKSNTLAVIQELKAKGFSLGSIEHDAYNHIPNQLEVNALREFAWHLDNKGNVIHIRLRIQ